MSILKPLYAGWVVDLYKEMTSKKYKDIISSGCRAGITDAISLGIKNLSHIDPYHDIDGLLFRVEENKIL